MGEQQTNQDPGRQAGLVERLLCRVFRFVDIVVEDELYLRRWFVVSTRWGRLYLHKICKSDAENPHDHPWDFTSLVLRGGYYENVFRPNMIGNGYNRCPFDPYASEWRGAGSIGRRRAEHVHRVEVTDGQPAWTLVLTGRYRRHWQFWVNEAPIFWRDHLQYDGPDNLDPLGGKSDIRRLLPRPFASW